MTIGKRIAAWRLSQGKSMRGLAREAGIYASVLHRLENDRKRARVDEIEALAKALGVSMVRFYGKAPRVAKATA